MFLDKPIANTDHNSQTPEYQGRKNYFHPFSLFSPLDEEEERHCNPSEQEIWGQ